jgi:hypothetical protein
MIPPLKPLADHVGIAAMAPQAFPQPGLLHATEQGISEAISGNFSQVTGNFRIGFGSRFCHPIACVGPQ